MNPHDVVNGDDEQFTLLLACYSEALIAGGVADPSADPALPSELRQRLQRALASLRRLRRARPQPLRLEAVTRTMAGNITLHDGNVGGQLGRFRILRTLGHGGGGIVLLAFDPDLRREVALKIPHLTVLLAPELRRRFLREARAAAALDHPNLVPVHEVGETGGMCYLVSAYCRGGSLAQWLAERATPVPVRQAAEWLAALADAVQCVHAHGIYHRDIKPGNILLDFRTVPSNGETTLVPRLADFGLAKLREGQTDSTRSGAVLGTASYMAIEQVEGRLRDIGPATDVYGLGAVLYEMLMGRPPFKGATNAETLHQSMTEDPATPRRLRRDLPPDLETICLKCLKKEPARRYKSAAELAGDLRRFLAGESIEARPRGEGQRLVKWTRRHPWATAFSCCGCLAVLVLAIGGLWLHSFKRVHEEHLTVATRRHEDGQETIRQKEWIIRQYRYADDIGLAAQLLNVNRLEEMAEHLMRHSPAAGMYDPRGFEWHYLSGQARLTDFRSKVLSWLGHRHGAEPREAWAVAFSPDGKTLASAGDDHAVRLWDWASGRERAVLSGHQCLVTCLAFSPNGRLLASGSFDPAAPVKLWDSVTGAEIATLVGHTRPVNCLAFSPDGRSLATAGRDNTVQLWNLASRQSRDTLFVPSVESLAYTPDGRGLVLASDKKSAFLWDIGRKKIKLDLSFHPQGHVALAVAPDGKMIVSGDASGMLRFWDLKSGEMHTGKKHHDGLVNCLAFAPGGKTVASAGFDKKVKLWQATTGRELLTLPQQTDRVRWLAFSADGSTLATAGHDGILKIYRADKSELRP